MNDSLDIVILGLTITSSWGNGHATTFRSLIRELDRNGHKVLFLEKDVPWYAANRDMPEPPYGKTFLYGSLDELRQAYGHAVRAADVVIVGSYTPDGVDVGEWVTAEASGVTAFYDIDTPVTLGKLARNDCEYVSPEQVSRYDLYLSFTGGPTLQHIEDRYGSPMARPLYCSADPELYCPEPVAKQWDLGYIGTYAEDRQSKLDALLSTAAHQWNDGRFIVAGPMYPDGLRWPENVERIEHLPPDRHRGFYNSQRLTLNLTRADMVRLGYSPSVRLFEAAACGCPVVSDEWAGLDDFFTVGEEILTARDTSDVLRCLRDMQPERLEQMGRRARRRVLAEHTAAHRAAELEGHLRACRDSKAGRRAPAPAMHQPGPPAARRD